MEPKKKGHMNFYECCDLRKKVYIIHRFALHRIFKEEEWHLIGASNTVGLNVDLDKVFELAFGK